MEVCTLMILWVAILATQQSMDAVALGGWQKFVGGIGLVGGQLLSCHGNWLLDKSWVREDEHIR